MQNFGGRQGLSDFRLFCEVLIGLKPMPEEKGKKAQKHKKELSRGRGQDYRNTRTWGAAERTQLEA